MPATGDRITKRKGSLFQEMNMAQTPDGPKWTYICGRKYGEGKTKLAEALGVEPHELMKGKEWK